MPWWLCAYLIGSLTSVVMIRILTHLGVKFESLKRSDLYIGAFMLSWVVVFLAGTLLILISLLGTKERK